MVSDNTNANGPFVIQSSATIYSSPWLSLREDQVIRPGGHPGRFAIVTMRAGSSVVAIDGQDRILLAREHKYAVEHETLELVSGGIDDSESALEAAQRELREEAGVSATQWTPLGVIDPFTTSVSSPNHLFMARDLRDSTASPDEGEVVTIVRIPFDDAIDMVLRSEITHGASCVAILKAARHLGR